MDYNPQKVLNLWNILHKHEKRDQPVIGRGFI